MSKRSALLVPLVAILYGAQVVLKPRRFHVPAHMLNTAIYEENLLSENEASELRDMVKSFKEYPTNLADTDFYETTHEHIGEAIPMVNGSCNHPFLMPNKKRTLCIMPGRIDVGRHFIMTGGLHGLREPYESLVSRVQSFGRYMFDLSDYPVAARLFDNPRFVDLAKRVCPAHKQHLDPFQFNFIVQIPGQTVAAHIDGVYFWGATRFQFPQWLLAVMTFSNRFSDEFVDQVQVVAYLHEWETASRRKAGEFIHWASAENASAAPPSAAAGNDDLVAAKASVFEAAARAGSAIDGSKSVHAAEVYLGSAASPQLPYLDKNKKIVLRYEGPGEDKAWTLKMEDQLLERYSTDDLRTSIVYRARCFKDADEAKHFGGNGGPTPMTLERILRTLSQGLVELGKVRTVEEAMRMDRLKLSLLLIDTYVHYPLPDKTIPYNHCALPRLLPAWARDSVSWLLKPTCKPI